MFCGVLMGTDQGRVVVSFNTALYLEVATRIVIEFGFTLCPINNVKQSDRHFEYPHDFRVFCCRERYKNDGQ